MGRFSLGFGSKRRSKAQQAQFSQIQPLGSETHAGSHRPFHSFLRRHLPSLLAPTTNARPCAPLDSRSELHHDVHPPPAVTPRTPKTVSSSKAKVSIRSLQQLLRGIKARLRNVERQRERAWKSRKQFKEKTKELAKSMKAMLWRQTRLPLVPTSATDNLQYLRTRRSPHYDAVAKQLRKDKDRFRKRATKKIDRLRGLE